MTHVDSVLKSLLLLLLLTSRIYGYLWGALAPSTRRAYAAGEKHFIRFCLKHGLVTPTTPLVPASEVTLIYWVAHLAESVKFHTIKVYLVAIQDLHVEFNCTLNFAGMPRLLNTIRGIKHSLGLTRRDHQPITLFILERILHSLSPDRSSDIDAVMLWASFTLAFFGFMRCSELQAMVLRRTPN